MLMDERKQKVLMAVIRDYITTAEPVGSRTISRKYNLGVSPATIRNEMADLEDLGFIEQPYTSAGRVPSDKGYRYYVDFLMEKLRLGLEDKELIRHRYRRKMSEIEEIIRVTGELFTSLTDYASIILGPQYNQSTIRYVEVKRVDDARALLLVVTDTGIVEHRLVDISESVTSNDLVLVSEVLCEGLRGMTLDNVTKTVLDEIYHELRKQGPLLDNILELIQEVLSNKKGSKIYLDGTLNILKQPEFKNIEKLHSLLSFLEEETIVKDLINQPVPQGLAVKIGCENEYEGIHDCSLITATYSLDGKVVGSVGVLGPTRMEYSRVVSLMEFITETLSETITKYCV